MDDNGREYGLGGWYEKPLVHIDGIIIWESRSGTLQIVDENASDWSSESSIVIDKSRFEAVIKKYQGVKNGSK